MVSNKNNNTEKKKKKMIPTSLDDFVNFFKDLEKKVKDDPKSIQDVDFVPIFSSLQKLVDNGTSLDLLVSEFGNVTNKFEEKIRILRKFIEDHFKSQNIDNLLEKSKNLDETQIGKLFSNILRKSWVDPLILDQGNISYLSKSFISLTRRKKKGQYIHEIPLKVENTNVPDISIIEQPFDEALNNFTTFLMNHIPCKIQDILGLTESDDDYFSYFLYILHLIQNKVIEFDKKTGQIRLIKKEKQNNIEKSRLSP